MEKKARKTFLIGNILILICAMICLVCYDLYGGLRLKGTTSFWFVLLGFWNLLYARKQKLKMSRFLLLMELGLCFGMCADVLLGIQFMLGILFFALGHVLYLAAFCTLEKLCRRDVCIILPIAVISLYFVAGTPYIQIGEAFLKKVLLVYAVIIACMLGKAVSNWLADRSISRILIFLGSAMFWFSDLMLAVDLFGRGGRLTWILCSYTYWPAQSILAFSLFHFINEQTGRADRRTAS